MPSAVFDMALSGLYNDGNLQKRPGDPITSPKSDSMWNIFCQDIIQLGGGRAGTKSHHRVTEDCFPNQPLAGTPAAAGHVQGPGMAKGFDFYSTKNEVLVLSLSLRLMPSFSAGLENYLKELMFFWGLGNFDETS